MQNINFMNYLSPLGTLSAFEEGGHIIALEWGRIEEDRPSPLLQELEQQLQNYFEGKLKRFELPLNPEGTAFQQSVWAEMGKIPYGESRRYGELAEKLNSSARAVGTACGKNPIPIIIPCHRVIGGNGLIGGYSAGSGPSTKINLLTLEGVINIQ